VLSVALSSCPTPCALDSLVTATSLDCAKGAGQRPQGSQTDVYECVTNSELYGDFDCTRADAATLHDRSSCVGASQLSLSPYCNHLHRVSFPVAKWAQRVHEVAVQICCSNLSLVLLDVKPAIAEVDPRIDHTNIGTRQTKLYDFIWNSTSITFSPG